MDLNDVLHSAPAAYKKQDGSLLLTRTHLYWVRNDSKPNDPSLSIDLAQLNSLFASKEGSPKVLLRVGIVRKAGEPEENVDFRFTHPSDALPQRELFKKELSRITGRNKEKATQPEMPQNGAADTEAHPKAEAKPKEEVSLIEAKKAVLHAHPELAALHRQVVMTKMLSENDFWIGREGLIQQAMASKAVKRGRAGSMIDLKPTASASGEVSFKMTPQLIRDMFDDHPALLRAYNENVPDKLNDQQFWTRYFQSKLFAKNRTSNRQAISAIRPDDIFDQYLEEDDDDIEPRKPVADNSIYGLLDISSTAQDQHEFDTPVDMTMRAGKVKSSLPLIRRFNAYSERLLDTSLGPMSHEDFVKDKEHEYENEIMLEDLDANAAAMYKPVQLNPNVAETHQSMAGANKEEQGETSDAAHLSHIRQELAEWTADLSAFHADSGAYLQALANLDHQVHMQSGLAQDARENPLPNSILKQLVMIHAATTEFLRQFWLYVVPPGPKTPAHVASLSQEQRYHKVLAMRAVLDKTEARFNGIKEQTSVSELPLLQQAWDPVLVSVRRAQDLVKS